MNTVTKQDYYGAQTAATIARCNAKDPKKISIKDFILKFTFGEGKKIKKAETTKEQAAARSKGFWKSILGMK